MVIGGRSTLSGTHTYRFSGSSVTSRRSYLRPTLHSEHLNNLSADTAPWLVVRGPSLCSYEQNKKELKGRTAQPEKQSLLSARSILVGRGAARREDHFFAVTPQHHCLIKVVQINFMPA